MQPLLKEPKFKVMSRVCQITGKSVITGNNVSKSKRRTKRTFAPNLSTKRFFNPETGQWVKLKVSASGIRTINKNGVAASIKKAKALGYL